MKRAFTLMLAVIVLTVFAMPVLASTAGERFTDGLKTAAMSPKQIPDNIQEEYDNNDNKVLAVAGGTLKGLFYFGKDLIGGLFQALTFPVDWEGNSSSSQ